MYAKSTGEKIHEKVVTKQKRGRIMPRYCKLCEKDISKLKKTAKFCCDTHRVMYFYATKKYKNLPLSTVKNSLNGIDINEWILVKVINNEKALKRIENLLKNKENGKK